MTIYIVVALYPYEGYDFPRAAFTTKKAAEEWASRHPRYENGEWEIHELTVDGDAP